MIGRRWIAALMLAALPAGASAATPWLVATTRHFRVYGQVSRETATREAAELERYDGVLRTLTGLTADSDDPGKPRLTIYILGSQAAVVHSFGSRSRYVYGYYEPTALGSFVVVPETAQTGTFGLDARTILFHEYAHHFMLDHFPAAYAPWFVEGSAEFFSNVTFVKGDALLGQYAKYRLPQLVRDWGPPLARLIMPGTRPLSDDETLELYGRAWLLTHYLMMGKARQGQIAVYLAARANGADEPAAFAKAFHATLPEIDKEIRAYLMGSKMFFGRVPAPPPPGDISVATVPPGPAGTLPLIPVLRHFQRRAPVGEDRAKQAAGLLAAARALGAAYPHDPQAQETLAEAEAAVGTRAAAITAADAAIAADPGCARAWLVKAQAAMATLPAGDPAALAAARRLIVTANRADPDDPQALIAYYRSFADHGAVPPDIAVHGLERAEELAPQDPDIRLMLADRYAGTKRYAEAAALLRPIAFSPHGGGARDAAQAKLAALPIAHDEAPPPAADAAPPAAAGTPPPAPTPTPTPKP